VEGPLRGAEAKFDRKYAHHDGVVVDVMEPVIVEHAVSVKRLRFFDAVHARRLQNVACTAALLLVALLTPLVDVGGGFP